MVVFDLSKALSLEGDTGPYILYSYVRASRILEKASAEGLNPSTPKPIITQLSEKRLLKALSKFDLVVEEAVKTLSPKTLARYAIQLATLFNNFYESTPVLSCLAEDVRASRLMLVAAFKAVLGKTMELLGLPIVERM
jgi:arginyl-tRNA synthetase